MLSLDNVIKPSFSRTGFLSVFKSLFSFYFSNKIKKRGRFYTKKTLALIFLFLVGTMEMNSLEPTNGQ